MSNEIPVIEREIASAAGSHTPNHAPIGDILEVSGFRYDSEDHTLEFDIQRSAGDAATYTETHSIDLSHKPHLGPVVGMFVQSILAEIGAERPLKCDNCTAGCCVHYGFVDVLESDLVRLTGHLDMTEQQMRDQHLLVGDRIGTGHVGYLGKAELPKGSKYPEGDAGDSMLPCVFLTWNEKGVARCGIYAARPLRCREYTERDCDKHHPADPSYKLGPKTHLKVIDYNPFVRGQVPM